MDIETQKKWNRIYGEQEVGSREPARILIENAHLLPVKGTALELAAGLAANAIYLAEKGFNTQAWDISDVVADRINEYACTRNLSLTARACDLERTALPVNKFDVIVVSYYLDRDMTKSIIGALKNGGLLFYQTFTRNVTPDYSGPSNPAYRLDRNELLRLFSDLKIVVYREEDLLGDVKHGLRNEAMLVAQKTAD